MIGSAMVTWQRLIRKNIGYLAVKKKTKRLSVDFFFLVHFKNWLKDVQR